MDLERGVIGKYLAVCSAAGHGVGSVAAAAGVFARHFESIL